MTITITHNPWFNQYVATIDDGENDYQILAPTKTELLNKIKKSIMKYLSDYMQQAQSDLFKQRKVFFAFDNEQFSEGMRKHFLTKQDQITGLGQGMYCPRNQAKKVLKELNKIYTNAIKQDIAENGIERIIKRELSNHECYYTGDTTDCIEKLKDYPNITEELIDKIFYKNLN